MSQKKLLSLTKVVNMLKNEHPDLPYDLLGATNINLLSIKDTSDSLTDLKNAASLLEMPILDPILQAINAKISEKKKSSPADKNLAELKKLLGDDVITASALPIKPSKEVKKKYKTTTPSVEKKVKRKGQKIKIVNRNPEDQVIANSYSLIFNNSVTWWKPFIERGKNQYEALCYCNNPCKKQTNQFSNVNEIVCEAPMNKRCGFKMNTLAFLKFAEACKEWQAKFFPIPKCTCDKSKLKNRVVVRGSSPNVADFKLWYYCEDCCSTYYFSELMKKINKMLKAQPKEIADVRTDDEEEDEDSEPATSDDDQEPDDIEMSEPASDEDN